jgi:hypothetical protein
MITVLYGNPCTVPVLFCKKIGIPDENRSFSKKDPRSTKIQKKGSPLAPHPQNDIPAVESYAALKIQ